MKDDQNIKIVCVGDKSRALLARVYGKQIILAANEIGRLPPTFNDASILADAVIASGYKFGSGEIVYNRFESVVSYNTQSLPVFSLNSVQVRKCVEINLKIVIFRKGKIQFHL